MLERKESQHKTRNSQYDKMTFSYKLNYSNSFISSLTIFFISFFIGLWIFFFLNPIIAIVGLVMVIVFLIYWNSKSDGKIQLLNNSEKPHIEIENLNLKENIKSIRFGWNYAFVNHGKHINISATLMNPINNNSEKKTTMNTFQKIILLELENGQNIILLKELLPWQETGSLPYIGHEIDKLEVQSSFFIMESYRKLKRFLEG